MIVYGDPQFRTFLGDFSNRLLALLNTSRGLTPQNGIFAVDWARHLLIACGQCEQAIEDYLAENAAAAALVDAARSAAAIRLATDAAAEMLLDTFQGHWSQFGAHAEACRAALSDLSLHEPDIPLTVKSPEGYDFYLLFPEQYVLAAQHWICDHDNALAQSATVVGLRSIGTSLSAVVAATLRRSGLQKEVGRVTVRPDGAPFDRRVALPDSLLATVPGERDYALVVDEGPGLSGSSMAAAYTALADAGFAPERIVLLPGHGNRPGGEGGEPVQRIWATATRYVAARDELRWQGATLHELLIDASLTLAKSSPELAAFSTRIDPALPQLYDLGSGAWRDFAYGSVEEFHWPPISPLFERPKFLWRPNGTHQGGFIWTYVGLSEVLGTDGRLLGREIAASDRLSALDDYSPPPCGAAMGFIATPWIDGTLLRAEEIAQNGNLLQMLAEYCRAASQPPLSESAAQAAWLRLREMLYWNTRELLGDLSANQASLLADQAAGERIVPIASYGDGRMAPQEWVRRADGAICKVDCAGHEFDHTIIGSQAIWWDLAGASMEWKLPPTMRGELWKSAQERLNIDEARQIAADSALARFYSAAYAAFRAGLLTLSAGAASNSGERARCERGIADCRMELLASLQLQ